MSRRGASVDEQDFRDITEEELEQLVEDWKNEIHYLVGQLRQFERWIQKSRCRQPSEYQFNQATVGVEWADFVLPLDELKDALVYHQKWVDHRTLLEKVFGEGEVDEDTEDWGYEDVAITPTLEMLKSLASSDDAHQVHNVSLEIVGSDAPLHVKREALRIANEVDPIGAPPPDNDDKLEEWIEQYMQQVVTWYDTEGNHVHRPSNEHRHKFKVHRCTKLEGDFVRIHTGGRCPHCGREIR